jgi:hypothetical protein
MRKNPTILQRLRSPGIMAAIGLAACTGGAADLTTGGMLPLGTDAAPGFLWRTYQIKPLDATVNLPNLNEMSEGVLAGCFSGTITGGNSANLTGTDTRGLFRIYGTLNFNNDAGTIGNFANDTKIPGLPGINGVADNSVGECLTYVEFPEAGSYTMGVNSDDGFRVTQGWARPRQVLVVNSPAGIAGPVGCLPSSTAIGGIFPPLPSTPINAEVVVADPVLAGDALSNAAAVQGKICVVNRGGGIAFAVKVKNAQDAGALAVIVVNETFPTTLPIMMGGDGTGITIPAVMISKPDGDRIKTALASGPVSISLGALDGLELGTFNVYGGRGAADTLFTFNVPEAGLYPLRLLWYNGGGGANVEWFAIDATGAKVLLNDRSNPASLRVFQGPVVTNWVAFNDHIAGAGTAANVSGYDLWLGPGGPLTNYADLGYDAGQELAATLGVRYVGAVAVAGTMIPPDAGTPAYDLFNGIIDMGTPCYLYAAAGQRTYMTFTGLDPNMFYKLRTTSVRGRDAEDIPDRWTVSSLGGTVNFVDASTPGVVTAANLPASGLTNGQAAWNSGRNRAAGEVVGWDYIVPAADGTLSVVSEIYHGAIPMDPFTAAAGPYGYGPECFMLEEMGAPSPLGIVAQPQAEVPGRQGRPFSVTVRVSGTTPTYQWYHDGAAIADAKLATYTVGHANAGDAGNYYAVAANAFGSVTSAVAHVAVEIDAVPPVVSAAFCRASFDASTQEATLDTVFVEFSETMDAAMLSDLGAYTLLGPDGTTPIAINEVTVIDGTTVELKTAPQTPNTQYTVSSTAIDLAGNPCAATNKVPFRSWVSSPANGLLFESYLNTYGTAVSNLTDLIGTFPEHPSLVTNIWAFDSRIVYPGDGVEFYGARMSGLFFPPRSGPWRFYIRSDDASQLFLNPNGPEAAGKQLILEETGCCGDWTKYESEAYTLKVGKGYYIEMLYKEGGGGDYGKVAARLDGTARPTTGVANTAIDPNALAGSDLGWPYAPADAGGPIVITQAPADMTVEENNMVTLKVVASTASGLPLFYQWRVNGEDIPGANGPQYMVLGMPEVSGNIYSVHMASLGSEVTSAPATLTVKPDATAPKLVGVSVKADLGKFKVSFSERLDKASAENPANYAIPGATVASAVLDANETDVWISVPETLAPGTSYTLTVKDVKDVAGNATSTASSSFKTYVLVTHFIKWETYAAAGGTAVADLTNKAVYPDNPRETFYLTSMNSREVYPDDTHENYGSRMRGFFVPPENGSYIFYIRSDDSSQLWFNPNGPDYGGMSIITEEPGCCNWFSKWPSAPQALEAGKLYAIEALHKEGGGGDYLQVAAKLDTDPTEPSQLACVPGAYLATLVEPQDVTLSITQQPVNYVAVQQPVVEVPPLLSINMAEGDGGLSVSNIEMAGFTTPVGPWIYDEGAGSWTCHDQPNDGCRPSGFTAAATSLETPPASVAADGKVYLTFTHRYSFEHSDVYYDGGQVRLSVNGAAFAAVNTFIANGYNAPSIGGEVPIKGQAAFGDFSTGYRTGEYITSVAELGSLKAGDEIVVDFFANWDQCSEGSEPNWEIKSIEITSGGALPIMASFSVGATSTIGGQPNSTYAYQWQRDDGAGFVDVLNATGATNTFQVTLADTGAKLRVVVFTPGGSITSQVAGLTVSLPLALTREASGLTISWPAPATGFVLEQCTSLSNPTWTVVPTGTYQVTPTAIFITVPSPITGSKFYRLRK